MVMHNRKHSLDKDARLPICAAFPRVKQNLFWLFTGLVLFGCTSSVRRVDNHESITVLEIIIVIKHLLSCTCMNGNFNYGVTLMCLTSSRLKKSLHIISVAQIQIKWIPQKYQKPINFIYFLFFYKADSLSL